MDGAAGQYQQLHTELALFNLKEDPFETTDVQEQYPEIMDQLMKHATLHRSRFYAEEE